MGPDSVKFSEYELEKDLQFDDTFQAVNDVPWAFDELIEIQRKASEELRILIDKYDVTDISSLSDRNDPEIVSSLMDEYKDIVLRALAAEKHLLERVALERQDLVNDLARKHNELQKKRSRVIDLAIKNRELEVRKAVKKVYPNDSCPCGSGKKYKRCCGR